MYCILECLISAYLVQQIASYNDLLYETAKLYHSNLRNESTFIYSMIYCI